MARLLTQVAPVPVSAFRSPAAVTIKGVEFLHIGGQSLLAVCDGFLIAAGALVGGGLFLGLIMQFSMHIWHQLADDLAMLLKYCAYILGSTFDQSIRVLAALIRKFWSYTTHDGHWNLMLAFAILSM